MGYQLPPDSLIRIYLGDRLLKQSLVVRNELKPMWSLTVGPIPEQRFYDGPIIVEVIEQDLWGEDTIESIMIPLPTRGLPSPHLRGQVGKASNLPMGKYNGQTS